jgi:hypothetical protein
MKILVSIDLPVIATDCESIRKWPMLGTIIATDVHSMLDTYQKLEPDCALKGATILNITYSD